MNQNACELCEQEGGEVIWLGNRLRVVLVEDGEHPGYCRVIWNEHAAEMTDLTASGRGQLMDAVWQVEAAIRAVMKPRKVNLASLGNAVPHLHWHVIPRYEDDAQFPSSIWAPAQRKTSPSVLAKRASLLPALCVEIVRRMRGGRD